ncbi:MAG: MmgE/PrpD family protein, partial [Primorskyibacter sp.]
MSIAQLLAVMPTDPATQARQVMRLSVLDWVACGVAGLAEPVSRAVHGMVMAEGGAAQASLFGGGAAPMRAAALVNGATSHALDYDDTHFAHIGHPSVAVVSAALAVGQARNAPLDAVIEAALAGCELSVRLGMRLGRGHYQVGFHQTATAGAFGAAYAAARLLSGDIAHLTTALALVSTAAAGLKSQFGTMGKPYNAGLAAANGVQAALLAQGFDAPAQPLSGANGFFATHHADGDWEQPSGWMMTDVSHKFHACCHGLHATLEALATLTLPNASQIVQIDLRTHPRWMTVCNQSAPDTGLGAKFSYGQVTALTVLGHDTAALSSYTDALAQTPDVVALRERVTVTADPNLSETQARVRITASGGHILRADHDLASPMALSDRTARVRAKARALIGPDKAEAVW